MALQGKCGVWSLICAFCIVFFEKTDATQARKEHNGLLGSKVEAGQQVDSRGYAHLGNRRGRGGEVNEEHRMKEQEMDHYSNIEMLLRKDNLEQNNSFVSTVGDHKEKIKNGIGHSAVEPDFDLSLGSWLDSLLYSDYDDEAQDISSHEHDDTHAGHSEDNIKSFEGQEMGQKHHSHSEHEQEERHGGEDHSEKKELNPTSSQSHAASVSMATWLVSFSSITVISLVRSTWHLIYFLPFHIWI